MKPIRVTEADGSEWVGAASFDALSAEVDGLRSALSSLLHALSGRCVDDGDDCKCLEWARSELCESAQAEIGAAIYEARRLLGDVDEG